MSEKDIKDQITRLLEDIVGQMHQINRMPLEKTLLQTDLVMDDLRSLYRLFTSLKQTQQMLLADEQFSDTWNKKVSETIPDLPAPGREVFPDLPVKESEEDSLEVSPGHEANEASPEESPEKPVKEPVEEPLQEPLEEPLRETVEETAKSSSATGPEDKKETQVNMPIGEKLAAGKDESIHGRLSSVREDRSIGTRLKQHPIASLKDAIGLNEKFLFINELFEGDINAYHEAIASLNNCESQSDAFRQLNLLGEQYNWSQSRLGPIVEQLALLVQRRYTR